MNLPNRACVECGCNTTGHEEFHSTAERLTALFQLVKEVRNAH